jgi:hypothetical protein
MPPDLSKGAPTATHPIHPIHPSWSALHPGEDPRAEALVFARLRETSGVEKFAAMRRLTAASRHLAAAGLRRRHPGASLPELQRYLADLLLGEALAALAYGPSPAGS